MAKKSKYNEIHVPVETFKVKMPCPDENCSGFLENIGEHSFMSSPGFPHQCSQEDCKEWARLETVYPHIEHKEKTN